MAQSYMWRVTYFYRKGLLAKGQQVSRVFTNKVEAMKFENQMRNDPHAKNVRFMKWFG